jgi:hypothetical protein
LTERLLEDWCIYILTQKTNEVRNSSPAVSDSGLRFRKMSGELLSLKDAQSDSLAECLVAGTPSPYQVRGDIH